MITVDEWTKKNWGLNYFKHVENLEISLVMAHDWKYGVPNKNRTH